MKNLTARILTLVLFLSGSMSRSYAQETHHEMQHGFVLSVDDKFASHLVATGHHSRQTEITGELSIEDQEEAKIYEERKARNVKGGAYFLFQAQALYLPALSVGQTLVGHIVESQVGKYEPKNMIVKRATFKVDRVLLNIENPFFGEN